MFRRRRKTTKPAGNHTEARKALRRATEELKETTGHNEEVEKVVKELKNYRDHNNFADLIREALGGSP